MNTTFEKFLADRVNPLPALISPRELAETGLVSVATLSKLRSKENGPAFLKIGDGQVKYIKDDVLVWLTNCYSAGKVKDKKGKTDTDMQLKFDY